MAVKIGRICLGMYQTNCYFLYNEGSKDCVVIDPADSGEYLYDKLNDNGFSVKAIMLTHGHFDHIYGVKALQKKSGAKVYAGAKEVDVLKNERYNCSVSVGRIERIEPDVFLTDNEVIELAGIKIKVIHTPGHTEGSVCYYAEESNILIAGDTLFCESVGRTDLPTGSSSTLIKSIREKLMILPDEVKVYPGHGESTTIGNERAYNPFLN